MMENRAPRPDTIDSLRFGADAALALLAGMQLDIFTPLRNGPMTTEQIADAIGVGPARLRLLLHVLVAAGLLTEQDGCFSNTTETQHFLVKGTPTYNGQFVHRFERKLATATSLRKGAPQAPLDFSHSSPEELEAVLRRINTGTVATAHALVERYDFASTQTLVDVGGGGGGLAITLAKAWPHLQATVLDLPQVTPITQKIVDEEGATDRVTIMEADVVSGPVPGTYDVAILRALLQVLSPEDARRAVQNISAAMNPDGTVYIVGQILDDSRTSPPEAVGFNLSFINKYEVGESYTEQEHRAWLSEAGFVDVDRADPLLPDGVGLITARKRG